MKRIMRVGVLLSLISYLLSPVTTAHAAVNVTATGTNPGICDQTVGSNTNVVAYRISGGDCVIEFKNAGAATTWTSPSALANVSLLVVAGGGGGGSRHSGGGGGGGVLYVTSYGLLPNTVYNLSVGDGGSASPGGTNPGSSRAGQPSYFLATSGSGSIFANGGGGGAGADVANNLNYSGAADSVGRGSGGGSNSDTANTAGASTPGVAGDLTRTSGTTSSMSYNSISATVYAYGRAGGLGKSSSTCLGPSGNGGWCGGGGGGANAVGDAPTRPGNVNPWKAGNGGAGIAVSITGASMTYGGGGGGGAGPDGNAQTNNLTCISASPGAGDGGAGGGGAGGQCLTPATAGSANTGGGGGGGGLAYLNTTSDSNGAGGKGGSGIIILRYTPDSTPPTFSNGTTFSIAENTSISTNAATLAVNESSTISVNAGSDSALFIAIYIDSVTARIRFIASPNFESPGDVGSNNQYDISVRATDLAGNITNLSIAISVTNVNEAPVIGAFSGADTGTMSKAENSASLYNINASDVDSGTTLTYSLTGTDAGDFSISSSGVLSFTTAPDFENAQDSDRNNVYIFVTWASDGALSDSQTVTITVTNVNESSSVTAPTISGTAYKGVAISLSIIANTPGKARFFMDGKRISNCLSVAAAGTYPNFTATCNWKPAVTARHELTATFTPSDNTFSSSNSPSAYLFIQRRTNSR